MLTTSPIWGGEAIGEGEAVEIEEGEVMEMGEKEAVEMGERGRPWRGGGGGRPAIGGRGGAVGGGRRRGKKERVCKGRGERKKKGTTRHVACGLGGSLDYVCAYIQSIFIRNIYI